MSAYTTFEFSFVKVSMGERIVKRFYDAIQVGGVSFDKVFAWGCSDKLSLGEVIEWNQQKLDDNFRLGFTEDVSNNYRQILLNGTGFETCRVFILNNRKHVSFCLLVPEWQVDQGVCSLGPIHKICRAVAENLPVYMIESYGEDDEVDDSSGEELPLIAHGGYVPADIYPKLKTAEGERLGAGYLFTSSYALSV